MIISLEAKGAPIWGVLAEADLSAEDLPPQPERWSALDLAIWLKWAAREFNVHSEAVNIFIQNFKVVLTRFFSLIYTSL